MTEELKPIGEVPVPETSASETGIEQSPEIVSPSLVEHAAERSAETAGERSSETVMGPLPASTATAPVDDAQIGADAKAVYDETDAEARVTKLVSLAEAKGVEHAVRVARKLNDFYVLDRMHDELSGRFYEALRAKGMIAE